MQTKSPNPARLHPMGEPHAPRTTYQSPCRMTFANAVVAWAHALTCWLCPILMTCDDCGAVAPEPHNPDVEH
jgi:hypothetical protein